jgi:hypothetical protein
MRETTTTTIGGFTIEHKTYLTAREGFDLRKADKKDEMEQTQMIVEMLVTSVNGSTEKIFDTILDGLTIKQFTDLQEVLVSIINPSGKSDSPSSTTATNE